MMSRSSRIVLVAGAILQSACSGHEKGDRTGEPVIQEECPGARENAWLLKRLQGTWSVGYADYNEGQKPPTAAPIGTLEFNGCRFRFVPLPLAEQKQLDSLANLALARRDLPFIDAPQGTIELDRKIGVWSYMGQPLGRVTLIPNVPEPTRWEIAVSEREQEGEYLSMVPLEANFYRWKVSRGTWRRRPGEFIPSSDPENPSIWH